MKLDSTTVTGQHHCACASACDESASGPRQKRLGGWLRRLPLWPVVLSVSFLGTMIESDARAQSLQDEMSALRLEIQQLRQELELLKDELRQRTAPTAAGEVPTTTTGAVAAPLPLAADPTGALPDATQQPSVNEAVPLLSAQVAEHAQTKVESSSRLPMKVFGTIISNTFFNTGEASWIDNPDFVLPDRPSLPAGSFSSTLRQSRVGAIIDGPLIGTARTSGVLTMDFYGGLANFRTGQVMGIPRMLYAFMRLDGARTAFEVGQDQMILAPRNPTSLAALYFPSLYRSGNLYLRAPQLRVERTLTAGRAGELQAVAGILAPVAGDFRSDSPVFILPNLAGERSRRPAMQARVAWRGGAGSDREWEIGVSGHDARERFATGSEISRAGALDFDIRAGRVGLAGEWFRGRNIDALGGSIGQVGKSVGGFLEGRLKASQRLDFNAGFGVDRLINRDRFPAPLTRNSSVFANTVFQFMPEVVVSFEYRWLSTLPSQGEPRRNHHLNLAFAYSF